MCTCWVCRPIIPSYIKRQVVDDFFKTFSEVLNCYRITGNENFVMEVVLKNQKHLESFIDQLIVYGETKTQIVLSKVVKNKPIKPTR